MSRPQGCEVGGVTRASIPHLNSDYRADDEDTFDHARLGMQASLSKHGADAIDKVVINNEMQRA